MKKSQAIPKLQQCFLCKEWAVEKDLSPIQVEDQAGYIVKPACKTCINKIIGKGKRNR